MTRLEGDALADAVAYNARLTSGDGLPSSLRAMWRLLQVGGPTLADEFALAVSGWQRAFGLVPDGCWGPKSEQRAREHRTLFLVTREQEMSGPFTRVRYAPRTPEAVALFSAAARAAQLPEEWADPDSGLHDVLDRESDGWVGIPNHTIVAPDGTRMSDPRNASRWPEVHEAIRTGGIGRYWPGQRRSTATGLGQLLAGNVRTFYPSGHDGLGDPLEEAVGMLRYIAARYLCPGNAWEFYTLPEFQGPKSQRPPGVVYGYAALARYGGPGVKPGGGY